MATVTEVIDRVVEWTEKNICQKVELKVPPTDLDAPDGGGYEYQRVHPHCFPLFVPGNDKLPPNVAAPIPSVCVRVVDGTDFRSEGSISLELWFSAWNPGTHGKDVLKPVQGKQATYEEWSGPEAEAYFQRNAEGWRDLWNWLDVSLREIESVESIDGLQIDREQGIKFGPAKDNEGIPDYYPFWFGFISLTLNRPIVRNIPAYEDLL